MYTVSVLIPGEHNADIVVTFQHAETPRDIMNQLSYYMRMCAEDKDK